MLVRGRAGVRSLLCVFVRTRVYVLVLTIVIQLWPRPSCSNDMPAALGHCFPDSASRCSVLLFRIEDV